jgi:hypothetical protein
MTVSKRRRTHADRLAVGTWIAVASTPLGWALGIVLAFVSGEGEARGIGPVTVGILGVLLFVAVPAAAVVLAVRAARAGYRSGRTAVAVSGSLLLVTLFLTLLLGPLGLVVTAVAAVLVFVGVRSRNKPSPPGPDGVRRPAGPPAGTAPPGGL